MTYSEGSIGITNAGAGRNRLKILNNTINGSLMSKMIEIYGNDHVINNNKLSNATNISTNATKGIDLLVTSNCLIMGNSIRGKIGYGITTSTTNASGHTISNNHVLSIPADIYYSSLYLDGTTTENCLVVGNRIPDGTNADNLIGTTPSFGVYNNNLIGLNFGLQDTRGQHATSGLTGFTTALAPHWILEDTNTYWGIADTTLAETRYLYFPINSLPNGAKLNSVQIQGKMPTTGGGTLTATIYKKSVKVSGLTTTAISSPLSMSSVAGEFGNGTTDGKVDITTLGGEIINYAESNYYLEIDHAAVSPTDPTDIRIYGITINFIY
jgi:hypothetical protein